IPAIRPRAELARSPGAHYSEADVRQYMASHRPGNTVPSTPTPTVDSVQFLTAKQVSTMLHRESLGLPDTAPVCLVWVSGTFQDDPPYGVAVVTYHKGFLVFNAQTGN